MNNQQIVPTDYIGLVCELLGVICVFEEKIEVSKQELAGCTEFDARVAFCSLDTQHKGHIDVNDLRNMLVKAGPDFTGLAATPASFLKLFFQKYGSQNRMSYEQFIQLIVPKNSPSLAQGLMVRGTTNPVLPGFLLERFYLMIIYYVIMTIETEELKCLLHREYKCNLVQLHSRIGNMLKTQHKLHAQINKNGHLLDIGLIKYLVNHTSSKTPLRNFSQTQYREVFSPIGSLHPNFGQNTVSSSNTMWTTVSPSKQRDRASQTLQTDSSCHRPQDNYLKVRYNSTKQQFRTNHPQLINQNTNNNYLTVKRNGELPSANSPNRISKQKVPILSPIPKHSVRNFDSVYQPMLQIISSNRIRSSHTLIPAPNTIVANVSRQSNLDRKQRNPQLTDTKLIDQFLKSSRQTSPRNTFQNLARKEIFQDDLQDSQNDALQYY